MQHLLDCQSQSTPIALTKKGKLGLKRRGDILVKECSVDQVKTDFNNSRTKYPERKPSKTPTDYPWNLNQDPSDQRRMRHKFDKNVDKIRQSGADLLHWMAHPHRDTFPFSSHQNRKDKY